MFNIEIEISINSETVKNINEEIQKLDDKSFMFTFLNQILIKADKKSREIKTVLNNVNKENPYSQDLL